MANVLVLFISYGKQMNLDFDPQKNYYEMLWVSEDADNADIKKAYRKMAMKYHPDRNKWDKAAEEKFKEINEANEVLSDTNKRQQYDAFRKGWYGSGFGWFGGGGFGWSGFSGWVEFWDLGDVIGSIFGWGFGGWRTAGPERGEDLELQWTLSFEDGYHGVEKEITFDRLEKADGLVEESCSTCKGRWVVMQQARTMFGVMQTQAACPDCGGSWVVLFKDGKRIAWWGLQKATKQLKVKVPAGIKSGSRLKYSGMGNEGKRGWPAWDLYVRIMIKAHDVWRRDDQNLLITVPLSVYDAVLGTTLEIPHPDGKLKVKVPKGVQIGEYIRVNGKWFGSKTMLGNREGDLIVQPQIVLPKKLSKHDEKLWQELKDRA
jgi:molecular chaperone DnaJ